MLSTVFAQPTEDSGALVAAWMQTVDILAQGRGSTPEEQRAEAFRRLVALRKKVPVEKRRLASAMLASRHLPADVIAFFGSDAPVVAAPLIATAKLDVSEWQRLLPKFPSTTRALMRERRDLPGEVRMMLSGFGSSDHALPSSDVTVAKPHSNQASRPAETAEPVDASPIVSQISELVTRIESYRKEREIERETYVLQPEVTLLSNGFRFETGADGVILWADDIPQGPIIGINLGAIASAGDHGVDGHAAGAFRKRTPFRDARMVVPGEGLAAGIWLISGTPWFNSLDGRFKGYRCTARRPLREENLALPQIGLLGEGLPPDSVRQLVHELRTPLNAIRGFAEMINGQLLGPVLPAYRENAQAIIDDSRRLLALFDDLDAAARLDTNAVQSPPSVPTDARRLLHSVAANLVSLTDARNVHLRISSGQGDATLAVDTVSVERMYSRLLSTMIGLAHSGETINAVLSHNSDGVMLTVDRPTSLAGLGSNSMIDPSYGPEGEWPDAPALGLGFTLRLLSNMARSVNGRFAITETELTLFLPHPQPSASQEIR